MLMVKFAINNIQNFNINYILFEFKNENYP